MKLTSRLIGYKDCFVKVTSEEARNIYTMPEGIGSTITGLHVWLHICIYYLSLYSSNSKSCVQGRGCPKMCLPYEQCSSPPPPQKFKRKASLPWVKRAYFRLYYSHPFVRPAAPIPDFVSSIHYVKKRAIVADVNNALRN